MLGRRYADVASLAPPRPGASQLSAGQVDMRQLREIALHAFTGSSFSLNDAPRQAAGFVAAFAALITPAIITDMR